MYLSRTSCIICGEHIPKLKHNLKTTYSEKSKVLLIKLVEKMYKNIFFLHCNICSHCHDLLNELDTIQQREKELYAQLSNHIAKLEGSKYNMVVMKETNSDIIDSFSTTSSSKNPEMDCVTALSVDQEDIHIADLKKLPIKIKRIPSNSIICHSVTFKPNLVKESQRVLARNEKVFEQIQNSIQIDLSKHVDERMNKCKTFKNVLCEICGQSFKTKLGYENHLKKHDDIEDEIKLLALNKIDEDWFCHVCGKNFNQKGALARHLAIHTGETRYQCEECGKKFLHHSSFNMHRKIHAGQRDFKCETCNHCFLTNSHLKRHLRSTHEKEKNHICKTCGKKFTENYNLVAHIKVVHKGDDDNAQLPPEEEKEMFYYTVQDESVVKVETLYIEESPSPVLYNL